MNIDLEKTVDYSWDDFSKIVDRMTKNQNDHSCHRPFYRCENDEYESNLKFVKLSIPLLCRVIKDSDFNCYAMKEMNEWENKHISKDDLNEVKQGFIVRESRRKNQEIEFSKSNVA